MKKNFRKPGIEAAAFFFLSALFAPGAALRAERPSADLNAEFAFKKMFVAAPADNVEGAYAQPASEAFARVFERNPRFDLVDKEDQADCVIRSKIERKASGTDLEIALVLQPVRENYAIERASLRNDASGGELAAALKRLLKAALNRIPFHGTVTGRDGSQVTLDIGLAQGLREGDVVQISRIDRVRRHPLLKTVVDIELVPVGSVEVTAVEDAVAFGKVASAIQGEDVLRGHKVTAIEARSAKERPRGAEQEDGANSISRSTDEEDDRPRMGHASLGVFLGGFSSSSAANGGAVNFSGSAFAPGVKVGGELWLTKNWFADLGLGFSAFSYSQSSATDSNDKSPESGQSARSFDLNFGYRYLIHKSIFGPQFFVKMGYRSFAWDPPVSAAKLAYPKSYAGFNLGFGGSLPVGGGDSGVLTTLNVLLFGSLDESGNRTGPGDSSMSAVNFFIGGYHFLSRKVAARAGFFFDSYSADFAGGSSTFASTSQKQVGFLPSILYYF